MHVSAAGITTRIWNQGGRQREIARRHMRKHYQAGVQIAFEYFENDETIRAGLMRLQKFMREEEHDDDSRTDPR